MDSIKIASVAAMAAMLVAGFAIATPAAYAQTFGFNIEESDGLLHITVWIQDQIADFVEETAQDADDEDLEDTLTDVSEEVVDDEEDAVEEIEDALNETDAENATEVTVEQVAEEATVQTVVNEIAENNTDVIEEAADILSEAIVEAVVNPSDDVAGDLEDAFDDAADVIENGLDEAEVEEILEDLEPEDVTDAIENEEIDLDAIITVISTGEEEELPADAEPSTDSGNAGLRQEVQDLQSQVAELESQVTELSDRIATLEEEATVGTTIEPQDNSTDTSGNSSNPLEEAGEFVGNLTS